MSDFVRQFLSHFARFRWTKLGVFVVWWKGVTTGSVDRRDGPPNNMVEGAFNTEGFTNKMGDNSEENARLANFV